MILNLSVRFGDKFNFMHNTWYRQFINTYCKMLIRKTMEAMVIGAAMDLKSLSKGAKVVRQTLANTSEL